MTLQDYLKLRNGTDIRGVAVEGVENEPVTLTEEVASNIAKAFCVWLISSTGKTKLTVAVGYDSRISSPTLCNAAVEGILSTGHDVVVTGLSTTPSMFAYLKDPNVGTPCDGSIMITASHLPFNRNGMKFFSKNGGLEGEDVKAILSLAPDYRFSEGIVGEKKEYSYLPAYAAALVESVRKATGENKPLVGKKIIVDAGNGAGGFFANDVLLPLGADIAGSQFLEPDGYFPNHIPNPENAEAMRSVCEAVVREKADFGIIFDTDVDRAGAVDKDGKEINRNRLIALISAILLQEKSGTIVTDSVTSEGLTKFIEERGGRHHRFKRGYKNVINEAVRLNKQGEYTPLAIETSGHAAMMENHFLDDGAYLITRLLIALANCAKEGEDLSSLIADLEMPEEEKEIRLRFAPNCDFRLVGPRILKAFAEYAQTAYYIDPAKENYEGCRVSYDEKHGNGWALLRMSLHDPILPINVESNEKHGAFKIVKDLYYFLRKYVGDLDITPLENAVEELRAKLFAEVEQAKKENQLSFI